MSPPSAAPSPPPLPFSLRDALVMARFELGEALRTRLIVVMLLLFVGGGGLGAWGFSQFIGRLEKTAAQAMGAPESSKAGATLKRLHRTPAYRQLMRGLTDDQEKADYFTALPPIVVFYAWITLMFTPWLILFTASDSIATEVANRGIRYMTLRTGRLEYALGKYLGQVLLLAGLVLLCGATFYLVAWVFMADFEHGATIAGVLSFAPRVLIHALPFLSLAFLASMVMSSANTARIAAISGAVGLAILSGGAESAAWRMGPISNALCDLAQYLTPFAHSSGLIYPRGAAFFTDVAVCLALAVVYFGAGYARLRARDL